MSGTLFKSSLPPGQLGLQFQWAKKAICQMYSIGRIKFFKHNFELVAHLLFLFLWELKTSKADATLALCSAMASTFLPFRQMSLFTASTFSVTATPLDLNNPEPFLRV